MKFKKPKVCEDYSNAISSAAIELAKLQYHDPDIATETLPKIWSKIKGDFKIKPANKAWTFIANCVSTALIMQLREPRMHCRLTEQELNDYARELVKVLPDAGNVGAKDLTNLALSQITKNCIEKACELIAKAAPKADFEIDQLGQFYREALNRSVSVVFQRQFDLFSEMVRVVTETTSTTEVRETEWERHAAWCRGLFYETLIFSPDDDIDIPLSQVYQRLRCYWHFEHDNGCSAIVDDLHNTIDTWLNSLNKSDAIRLIAGAPGSGKSSFAKAFAAELLRKQTHRVLFIQLQGIDLRGGPLKESIGQNLISRHDFKMPNKCEGFSHNPLSWHGEDSRPLLMIFDGLDDLALNKDCDLTKEFISNLKCVLNELNSEETSAAAIVLGRDVAMKHVSENDDFRLDILIHVAPIRKIFQDDLQLDNNSLYDVIENCSMEDNTRKAYWEKWCQAHGKPQSEPLSAIQDERMSVIFSEPLLLHLFITSDYCGDRWEEAASNRNLVLQNIFSKLFKRNKTKGLNFFKDLEQSHFFALMEVFGLAALRGNHRGGDYEDVKLLHKRYFNRKAKKYRYSELDCAEPTKVASIIQIRREIEGVSFEFVHKSFGEYFAARALLGAADRLQRFWFHDDNDEDEFQLAKRWVDFVGTSELSNSVLSFLHDECRLLDSAQIFRTNDALTMIFDETLAHGFPVQESNDSLNPTYRLLEHRQKCSEKAMLATITSLWLAAKNNYENGEFPEIRLRQLLRSSRRRAASDMIDRLFPPKESGERVDPTLSGMFLRDNDLFGIRISNADLRWADLSHANLCRADLTKAILSKAKLCGAKLRAADLSAANLCEANLRDVDLSRADLRWANLNNAELSGANLCEAGLRRADLRRAVLSEANLIRANLSKADLCGANLKGANLKEANLCEAELIGADLRGADLRGAYLSGADLRGAELSEAILLKADLRGAFIRGANLDAANLEGVDLSRVDLGRDKLSPMELNRIQPGWENQEASIMPNVYPLIEKNLISAVLRGAELVEAYWNQVYLGKTSLRRANLRGVNLKRSWLNDVDLSGADLSRADLSRSNLNRAELAQAHLTQANLNGASLIEVDLSGTDLSRAEMTQADLTQADLTRADLSHANLTQADLTQADLTEANLTSTELAKCRTAAMSVRSVDLSKTTNLTQKQVNKSFGVKSGSEMTLLSDLLSYPDHWYEVEKVEKATSRTTTKGYMQTWFAWRRSQ